MSAEVASNATFAPSVAGTYVITAAVTSDNWFNTSLVTLRLQRNRTPETEQGFSTPLPSVSHTWIVQANGVDDTFAISVLLTGNTQEVILGGDRAYFKATRVAGL